MKKLVSFFLIVCLALSLAACNEKVVMPDSSKTAYGEVGDIMRTFYLDFKILSIKEDSIFQNQAPPSFEEKFIVIEIYTKNTSDKDIEMFDTDYQLQWGTEGFADTIGFLHQSMAPVEKLLKAGENMTHYYVFCAPKTVNVFSICYLDNKYLSSISPVVPDIFFVKFAT